MLRPFAADIWTADGSTVAVAGFDYPTRMIVIRLRDGGLLAWSPVAITSELRREVDALGPVVHIVAPITLHHRFVAAWHQADPAARLHALPELRAKLPALPWTDDLDETPQWATDIDQVVVRGNRITTEVVFFHRRSRTAIFADLIQQFDAGWFKGWRACIARLDLLTAPKPTVPRKFRVAFHDRKAAREALRCILDWPTEAVLAAHAPPIMRDGRASIAHAFEWLLPASRR